MKKLLLLFLFIFSNVSFAVCETVGINTNCSIKFSPQKNKVLYLSVPNIVHIDKLYFNNHLMIKSGVTYYNGITDKNFIAKSSLPIPELYFASENQTIKIKWLSERSEKVEVKIVESVRTVYSSFKHMYLSFMSLVFALILLIIKAEFKKDSKLFNLAILTGLVIAVYLYFNTLEPYMLYYQYADAILKFHILFTSLATTMVQALTDKSLKLLNKAYYWLIPLLTLVLILIIPGWASNTNIEVVTYALAPTFFFSTIVSIHLFYKIIINQKYRKNRLLYPLMIVGNIVLIMCVIDTTSSVSESFGDAPLSGISMLLYYMTIMLTYFILNKQMEISDLMVSKKVAEVSRQVAHDVKSPITAIKIASDKFKHQIKESDFLFLRRSIDRISDIINDLSSSKKDDDQQGKSKVILLYPLIELVLSEKRFNFRGNSNLEIFEKVSNKNKIYFVDINPSDLKRSLSNVINNSAEAMSLKVGVITVDVQVKEGFLELIVEDNGKGIAEADLDRILEKNVTLGKTGGQGLGLSFAVETCKKNGGDVSISSKLNEGTKVTLKLPMVIPPDWFKPTIILSKFKKIILLDDDYNLHRIWEGRFRSALGNKTPEISSFYDPESFQRNLENFDLKQTLFFVDYEYIGYSRNGIDLIRENKLENVFLVTGRSEEESIQRQCHELMISLIPKELISSIEIVGEDNSVYVLIDDDALVRSVWEMKAKKSSVDLKVFESFKDFIDKNISKDCHIYIDHHLKQENGLECAKKLKELGYTKVVMATGSEDITESDYDFLDGVIGKDPPF